MTLGDEVERLKNALRARTTPRAPASEPVE
jgi:hypothetical protein